MSLLARQDAATPPENPFKLYHYDPTVAGGIIVALLFLGTTLLHFWQLVRARSWYVLPLAIGGICEYLASPKLTYVARTRTNDIAPSSPSCWLLRPSQVWD
jgi:hypothetical protein